MARINFELDDRKHFALKNVAQLENKKISEVLTNFIDEYLKGNKKSEIFFEAYDKAH